MPRLTADQWADARALREAGASLSEVAKTVGIDRAAVSRRAKAEKWSDGRWADGHWRVFAAIGEPL